jgi:hypothetical protein
MDYEKVVFQRSYSIVNPKLDPSTFTEWMDKFELILEVILQDSKAPDIEWIKEVEELLKLEKYLADIEKKFPLGYLMIVHGLHACRQKLLEEYQNATAQTLVEPNTKKGRKKAPNIIYELVIQGLELSKKNYNSYEPFRIYFTEGIKKDFFLNERLKANKTFGPPPPRSNNLFNIERFLDFQFPSVPSIKPEDTMWARNLKSTCKKAIE